MCTNNTAYASVYAYASPERDVLELSREMMSAQIQSEQIQST